MSFFGCIEWDFNKNRWAHTPLVNGYLDETVSLVTRRYNSYWEHRLLVPGTSLENAQSNCSLFIFSIAYEREPNIQPNTMHICSSYLSIFIDVFYPDNCRNFIAAFGDWSYISISILNLSDTVDEWMIDGYRPITCTHRTKRIYMSIIENTCCHRVYIVVACSMCWFVLMPHGIIQLYFHFDNNCDYFRSNIFVIRLCK